MGFKSKFSKSNALQEIWDIKITDEWSIVSKQVLYFSSKFCKGN